MLSTVGTQGACWAAEKGEAGEKGRDRPESSRVISQGVLTLSNRQWEGGLEVMGLNLCLRKAALELRTRCTGEKTTWGRLTSWEVVAAGKEGDSRG